MGSTTFAASEIQLEAMKTARFNVEVIAGAPIEKPLPKRTHQKVMQRIDDLLRELLPESFEVYPELNYICGEDLRIPDVCVCPADANFQDDDLASPAVLCVEIMSPGQTLGALLTKCEAYHRAGSPMCWVVWPAKRQAWMYAAGGNLIAASEFLAFHTITGEYRVEVAKVFAGLPAAE